MSNQKSLSMKKVIIILLVLKVFPCFASLVFYPTYHQYPTYYSKVFNPESSWDIGLYSQSNYRYTLAGSVKLDTNLVLRVSMANNYLQSDNGFFDPYFGYYSHVDRHRTYSFDAGLYFDLKRHPLYTLNMGVNLRGGVYQWYSVDHKVPFTGLGIDFSALSNTKIVQVGMGLNMMTQIGDIYQSTGLRVNYHSRGFIILAVGSNRIQFTSQLGVEADYGFWWDGLRLFGSYGVSYYF